MKPFPTNTQKPILKWLSTGVLSLFLLTGTAQAATLTDLQGHWSANDVQKLIQCGSVGGYPDGTFRPDNTITRAEFCKILRQSLQLATEETAVFSDVIQHWAYTDISTLISAEIIVPSEYGRQYGPDGAITRREIATMMVRAVGLEEDAVFLSGQPTGFSDDSAIAGYDKGYLYLARQMNLIGGYEDGSFRPRNKATRAEASVMIIRLMGQTGLLTPSDPPADSTPPASGNDTNSSSQTVQDQHTIQQVDYQLQLTKASRSSVNTLGEQYLVAALQLTVENSSSQPVTVSSDGLRAQITYANGAQISAIQPAFQQTIGAGQRKTIDTTIQILLPNNQVAQMVLGNSISDIQLQLTQGGQTVSFPGVAQKLMQQTR